MAERPLLPDDVRSRLGAHAGYEPGPRPGDLTVRLERAEDLLLAAAELGAAGFALATLVATDEEATEGDLKVRYVFEPGDSCGTPSPDLFVTLVASVDPRRPELPSLSGQLPAAIPARMTSSSLMKIENGGVPASENAPMSSRVPASGAIPRKPFMMRMSRVP